MFRIIGSGYQPPGVYGLTNYTVYKFEDGTYKIDYYSTIYYGTPKDIAKQIFSHFSDNPEYARNDDYTSLGSPFKIIMKPKLHIMFRANVNAPKDETLEEFAAKINDELIRYNDLIAFL